MKKLWQETTPTSWKGYCLLLFKGKLRMWEKARHDAVNQEERSWLEELQALGRLEEEPPLSHEDLVGRKEIKACLKKKFCRMR